MKREGASRATVHVATKAEALKRGRELAKAAGVELVIHTADGSIADSDSFGRDPSPPRDWRH